MGFLRLLLAFNVAVDHLSPIFGFVAMPGTFAVYSFYIISGFYMALILNEKYIGKKYKLFLSNRFLRIYPIYWLVLVLTLITFLLMPSNTHNPLMPFFDIYKSLEGITLIGTFVSDVLRNIFLIPSLAYFLPGKIFHDPFLVTVSWTLGLELIFYIIAPYIVRRNTFQLLIILIGCFFIRSFTYSIFYEKIDGQNLINPAFFPAVLFLFVLGALGYKLYLKIKKYKIPKALIFAIIAAVLSYTVFYNYFPQGTQKIYLGLIFLSAPILFSQLGNNRIDRFLGDLSYPIYISHSYVKSLFFSVFPTLDKDIYHILLLVFIVIFAYILFILVEIPIDKFRQKRLAKNP